MQEYLASLVVLLPTESEVMEKSQKEISESLEKAVKLYQG